MSVTTERVAAPRRGPVDGRGASRRRDPSRWLVLGALVVLVLIVLAPFVLVALNAFKSPAEYADRGPLGLPHAVDTDGVVNFWHRVDYSRKLLNSVYISGTVAVFGVVLSVLSAYALGIGRVRGRVPLLVLFLVANTLPQEGLLYPLYYLSKKVHMYDTPVTVIVIFTMIQSAFGTYLLASVYSTFPRELLDAAEVDGAGRLRTLWHVVVPVSRPTLGVLFTFFFIWTWNEFFLPLVFLVSNKNQTVPVALGVLSGDRLMDTTTTSGAALLGIVPAVVFFLVFQRTMTRGIVAGAIK